MLLDGREEQIAKLWFDKGPICGSDSESAPDLLYPLTLKDQDATREPAAQILVVLVPGIS
jgi:hypothetical protein